MTNPGNWKIITFFFGFVVLFVLAFSLGVIVGKGINEGRVNEIVRGEITNYSSSEDGVDVKSREIKVDDPKKGETDEESDSSAEGLTDEVEEATDSKKNEDIRTQVVGEEHQDSVPSEKIEQKTSLSLPKVEPGGKYTVQIGSFADEKIAKKRTDFLRSKGYPAFIKKVDIPDQGTRYRVRIGEFKTKDSAKSYADSLIKLDPGIEVAYVTSND
ncbi:MAG: SPOR domain-containing protein [Thermodesulfobacteriota bacterium]